MAYLPEPWTEMEDTEESWPLIQLTSSLVSAGVDEKNEKDMKVIQSETTTTLLFIADTMLWRRLLSIPRA